MTSLIIDIQSMPLWFSIPLGIVYLAALAYFIYTLWHYRRKNNIILLLFTIAALASGQKAMAESQTVTLSVDPDILEGTAGHWYVNLPCNNTNKLTLSADDLVAGKNVFKVYDDGGKDGNYSRNVNSYLSITIPDGYGFFVTGTVCTAATQDYLRFCAGESYTYITSYLRSDTDGEVKSIKPVILSNNRVLWIKFIEFDMPTQYAGLDLTVTIVDLNTYFTVNKSTPSHGTLAVDKATAKLGETVTVTPTPSANYSTAEVSYTVGTAKYVIEPDNGTYSFTMPAADVTVSAKFLDEVGYLWGEDADGTAEKPYVISDKAGWDLLVTKSQYPLVASDFKYYRLDADISDVTAGLKNFIGHLDGNHHKITFVDVPGGIITNSALNATFSNLSMEGTVDHDYVFQAAPSLTNCFVNVNRTGNGTFTTPSVNRITSTNSAYLLDGTAYFASGENLTNLTKAYSITLSDGATAVRTSGTAIGNGDATLYANGFSYGGKEYFNENATVTLGFDLAGYTLLGYTVSGATLGEDNTFTMPNYGVTVTAHCARTDYITHWQASMTVDGSTADKAYVITTTDGLNLLASEVNGGNKFVGTFFRLDADITYSHTTAWNDDYSEENNFDGIGMTDRSFRGTFDGGGHTISGIRMYNSNSEGFGLFCYVGSNDMSGTVKNIVLADARITGYYDVGGIVGENDGTVSGCTVKSNVTVFGRADITLYHGGVVGYNMIGTVSGCTSSARVTVNGNISVKGYGGIVGHNDGTISGCIAAGVVIADVTDAGAIVGTNNGTLSGNTYHSSLVGTNAFNIGVGKQYVSAKTFTYGDHTGASLDNSKLWLFDNRDNTAIIAAYKTPNQYVAYGGTNYPSGSKSYTVTLADRTLYKDGSWNTLCLPFNLDAEQVSAQLAPAALMTLSTSSFANGELTLNFADATTIEAGKPYIIKWAATTPNYVENPTFTGVTLSNATNNVETTYADFCGTYSPITWNTETKSILFLGTNNTLYYPKAGAHIGAFRCYFELGNGLTAGEPNSAVRGFNLNFDEHNETTGIVSTTKVQLDGPEGKVNFTNFTNKADAWYSINGVKLDSKPTQKGLYLHGGRKVVIK